MKGCCPCLFPKTTILEEELDSVKPKIVHGQSSVQTNNVQRTPSQARIIYNGDHKVEEVSEVFTLGDNAKTLPSDQWVVGLDFGTTFSGFAYARRSEPDNIVVYYDWPQKGGESRNYCKTLTGIYYKPNSWKGQLECASWGYIARSDYLSDQKRSQGRGTEGEQGVYLSKFKLLLKKDLSDKALAASLKGMDVNRVITDYLRQIGELFKIVVKRHQGEHVFKNSSIEWCVTVPSIWDEGAKQQMRACMVAAGLVSDRGPTRDVAPRDSIIIVLEPEAASFHCHKLLRNDVSLKRGDKILVADIGGGTVDIVVQEWLGSYDTYKVRELTESSGGLCGGTYVDQSFMNFMYRRVACLQEFLEVDVPAYKTRLLKDWDEIKCTFGLDAEATDTKDINLDHRLASKWESYEKARGNMPLRNSYAEVELSKQDLESIFEPVVEEILQLINTQMLRVPDINVMFVVGGFAASPYVMDRIRQRFAGEIKHIVSPPNPGSAVCQGAVSLALNPEAIESRIAKKTYGTSVTLPYEPGFDPPDLITERDGVKCCRDRFDTFVKKGTRVEVDMCITKEYVPHSVKQKAILFDLYSSTETSPRYTRAGSNVTKEGGFSVQLPQGYSADNMPLYKFSMFFGRSSIELQAEAQFKDAKNRPGQSLRKMELPVSYTK